MTTRRTIQLLLKRRYKSSSFNLSIVARAWLGQILAYQSKNRSSERLYWIILDKLTAALRLALVIHELFSRHLCGDHDDASSSSRSKGLRSVELLPYLPTDRPPCCVRRSGPCTPLTGVRAPTVGRSWSSLQINTPGRTQRPAPFGADTTGLIVAEIG